MKRLLRLVTVCVLAAVLSTPCLAAGAELVRTFVYDGTLYTYVTFEGLEEPITQAEAKLGGQTFPATARLETVKQAGTPITWMLLVDCSTSMPAFRGELTEFAAALAETGGEKTRYLLATFGDSFQLIDENVPAERLAEETAGLAMTERATRLHTCIDSALDYFEGLPRNGNELRCLVVLSDAVLYDPQGGVPYEQLLERVSGSDIMLHSVGFGKDTGSLERLAELIRASGGAPQVIGGEFSAASAAAALAERSGQMSVTGFSLDGCSSPAGDQPVSVTFAAAGTLVCRAESTVALPVLESAGGALAQDPDKTPPPAQTGLATPAPEQTAPAPAPEPEAKQGAGLWIAIAAAVLILAAVCLLLLRRRKAPQTPPSMADAAEETPPGIFLRMDVFEGSDAGQSRELQLDRELWIGSGADCGIRLENDGLLPRHARIVLREDGIWLENGDGRTLLSGVPLDAPARLRSGDPVGVGDAVFRLMF